MDAEERAGREKAFAEMRPLLAGALGGLPDYTDEIGDLLGRSFWGLDDGPVGRLQPPASETEKS